MSMYLSIIYEFFMTSYTYVNCALFLLEQFYKDILLIMFITYLC